MGVQQKFPFEAIERARQEGERQFKEKVVAEMAAAACAAREQEQREWLKQAGVDIVKLPGFVYQPGMLRRTSHMSVRITDHERPMHKVEEWIDLTDPATIGALEDWLRRLRGDVPRPQDKARILCMWAKSLLGAESTGEGQ